MPSQPVQLIMRTGPTPGKVFDLGEGEITIGRDIANDIVISDAEISRKHARLVAQGGGYLLEDMGSTNGTFVNGQRLMGPHMLRNGELILFGENVSMTFEQAQYDPNATMVSAPHIPNVPPPREAYPPPQEAYNAPPQPVEAYPPPQMQRQQAPPPRQTPPIAYAGNVPPGPVASYPSAPVEDEGRASNRTWIIAGCGCLAVVLCLVLTGMYAFDALNLYCTPPFNGFFTCT